MNHLFCLLISVALLQSIAAQYKAPLYMGFLMPKKYTRNLTNMPKPKPNCGTVCPMQQQQMTGSSQNFNHDSSDSFLSTPHQFNSYQSSSNQNNMNQNSNQNNFQSNQNNMNQMNDFKFPATSMQWEKNVQQFNNFPMNSNKNDQQQQMMTTKFVCCGNQNGNNGFSKFSSQPSSNTYSSSFNWNQNLYNKHQWDSPPSFDQWVKQQPQDGPFVLYTGSQIQQRPQFSQFSTMKSNGVGAQQEPFAYPTARVVNMNNQVGYD